METRQYMPLRVNQAGVMPIIFAQSLLMVPPLIFRYLGGSEQTGWQTVLAQIGRVMQSPTSMVYTLVYIGMIYFFCYFLDRDHVQHERDLGQHEGQRKLSSRDTGLAAEPKIILRT